VLGPPLLLLCCIASWLAITGASARSHLTAAREGVSALRAAVLAGDQPAANRLLADVQTDASIAHRRTSGPLWRAVSHVPLVGPAVTSARGVAAVVDDLARGPLQAVIDRGSSLSPATLHPAGGHVDLAALVAAQAPLASALSRVQDSSRQLDALPHTTRVGSIDSARTALARQVAALTSTLRTADRAGRLLPPMLGADGPRNYFLAFQTNAEARGTGGLVGGYAILRADHGALRLISMGDNTQLGDRTTPAIDLGPEFTDRYAQYGSTTHWNNSNMSPHFPSVAAIWLAMWQRRTGQRLDGAMATDPVALSHLLAATGPARLPSGEGITAGNVVRLTESTSYSRFANDNNARKAYLQAVAKASLARVLSAPASRSLLGALMKSAGEGRLLMFSAHPAEQALLAGTSLVGVLPITPRPFAEVVVNNAGGNKLDYYLGRDVTYTLGTCRSGRRASSVVVRLTNNAPTSGLTAYAGGRLDGTSGQAPGSQRLLISLYATHGAELTSVAVDRRKAGAAVEAERGHPVFTVVDDIAAGSTGTVRFRLDEPIVAGSAVLRDQPLVRPTTLTSTGAACGIAFRPKSPSVPKP